MPKSSTVDEPPDTVASSELVSSRICLLSIFVSPFPWNASLVRIPWSTLGAVLAITKWLMARTRSIIANYASQSWPFWSSVSALASGLAA